jgi:hypothetical protein
MRLVLSRKGFDGGSGGCPSPIMPDGRMVSLPIPDKSAPHTYNDLNWAPGMSMGALIHDLAPIRVRPDHFAHLDPDIDPGTVSRKRGWRPLFGQGGSSQTHLANSGVGAGDLFLFFGLFREATLEDNRLRFARGARPAHVLFGWLQVDAVRAVDQSRADLKWAGDHPHLHSPPDPRNVVYVARQRLDLPGVDARLPGAGLFRNYSPDLQLTAPGASTSEWLLPSWFEPVEGRPPLTYHGDPIRWRRDGRWTRLRTVGRGQEFVLDVAAYPEAQRWLASLFRKSGLNGQYPAPARA